MSRKSKPERVHFIAIGGAVMHNLAVTLKNKGLIVTGSDDEVFEPSRSRLLKHGLLPAREGWNPEIITKEIDFVILGMHARKDNPELLKVIDLGIKIFSFPEYVYELTRSKTRTAVCGSHGKTTITAMVMHILNYNHYRFDYLVGSQLKGFETMAGFSENSSTAILEGDEYLSSPLDPRPKFLWYKPHICVISGIAWDHINVFPEVEDYIKAFAELVKAMNNDGTLIYYMHDKILERLVKRNAGNLELVPYDLHKYKIKDHRSIFEFEERDYPVRFFGNHNMQNFNAARNICKKLGLSDKSIYEAIGSFEGASRRLQKIASADESDVFHDFAHSPSKLRATVNSVKEQYPERHLVACMELHTFSSLNPEFIPQYANTMDKADTGIIYFDPAVFRHKNLKMFTGAEIRKAFDNDALNIFTDKNDFINFLEKIRWKGKNLLLMSSGNFSGIDISGMVNKLLNR